MKPNFVLFTHPSFLPSQSMPRFAQMIVDGMIARNCAVMVWSAKPFFWHIICPQGLKKWLGYIDQFIVFPLVVRWRMLFQPKDTLYVFADQALGPWVPLVRGKPHVIHVHDFMALRSARGEFAQNPVSFTGIKYQEWIRRGFSAGQAFICVSHKTRDDLLVYLDNKNADVHVVHNGLNFPYRRLEQSSAKAMLAPLGLEIPARFLIHVGGNQWYKNRAGVLEIYRSYAGKVKDPLPLWMIGQEPNLELRNLASTVPPNGEVKFLVELSNEQIMAAYSLATLLVFPSIAEGFGWPIVEAMACGCPVLTTGEAPMTEVGGTTAFYIPAMPTVPADQSQWASLAADKVREIAGFVDEEHSSQQIRCQAHAERFSAAKALDAYEQIYLQVLNQAHPTKEEH